eukprot:TRINITY_DN121158_c0_g1_i1.p1 TRINITY_DN121158_c0_g1~~TRINITY_DN121158_c0_g1_i1.p1  ORF type:complete len:447 (+),score=74.68 TRINITY_DN121158_c0_g1_i1:126-1466(+)
MLAAMAEPLREDLLADGYPGERPKLSGRCTWRMLGLGLALAGFCLCASTRGGGGFLESSRVDTSDLVSSRGVPTEIQVPPLIRISAPGLRAAGFMHGQLARERIHGWFATSEMRRIFEYVRSDEGREAFRALKEDNAREFPEYVEEMEGLAEGAGVTLDSVWCGNLLNELGSLMSEKKEHDKNNMHCSDFFAVADGGYDEGFAEGHNEDWSDVLRKFIYYVSYEFDQAAPSPVAKAGRQFGSCAGLGYPAHIPGSTPSWNAFGLYASVNQLTPLHPRPGGLALALLKRRALCESSTLESFVKALTVPGWSSGVSANFVDLHSKRMFNIETYEDRHSIMEVTASMGNYSHFNEYRHLQTASGGSIDDPTIPDWDVRQAVADSLPSVKSAEDIRDRLSNPQIFSQGSTITTLILNGSTGELRIWCCGIAAADAPPVHTWNVHSFFGGK